MARIRTIKPEFFRHEELQELGAEAMLVFAGLWTQCDSKGRFVWRPRQLKLDILPFMGFDMGDVLEKLRHGGFVVRYEVGGKLYGHIPTFRNHQRITGKEAMDGEKHPAPIEPQQGKTSETEGKQQGNTGDQQDVQEREREREKEREWKKSIVHSPDESKKYTDEFISFWAVYPRKVGKDKAWEAWRKRRVRPPGCDELTAIIKKQATSDQWTRNNGQFIPNPATWLNQGRWKDELTYGNNGSPQKQRHSGIQEWLTRKQEEGEHDET